MYVCVCVCVCVCVKLSNNNIDILKLTYLRQQLRTSKDKAIPVQQAV